MSPQAVCPGIGSGLLPELGGRQGAAGSGIARVEGFSSLLSSPLVMVRLLGLRLSVGLVELRDVAFG